MKTNYFFIIRQRVYECKKETSKIFKVFGVLLFFTFFAKKAEDTRILNFFLFIPMTF